MFRTEDIFTIFSETRKVNWFFLTILSGGVGESSPFWWEIIVVLVFLWSENTEHPQKGGIESPVHPQKGGIVSPVHPQKGGIEIFV